MPKILWIAIFVFVISVNFTAAVAAFDWNDIDRVIACEPQYQDQPHYALFVFGPEGQHRSWLAIDGDRVAYIDRNGNGDLTDPEDRVDLDVEATKNVNLAGRGAYQSMHIFPLGEVFGKNFLFKLWVRNPDFDASQDDFYRDYFREFDEKKWVNGTLLRTAPDGSGSQNPVLLTAGSEDAQISRFDGPISADLKWGQRQRLESWPKEFVFDVHLGHRNLLAKDCDHQGFGMTRYSTYEVPDSIQPVAIFEFPEVTSGDRPVTREITLNERCCGDTFYATMTLPKEVQTGVAKVTVHVEDWLGQGSEPAVFEVPINQEVSRHSEAVYIMFHRPGIAIKDAVNGLRKRGLDVSILPEGLLINENGAPAYGVRLVTSEEVQRVSAQLGEGTEHAEQLRQCGSRFEIGIANAEMSISDESSVLEEIRAALQELTGAYVYQTWDKRLITPR